MNKQSKFNMLVQNDEEGYLMYNSFSGALCLFNEESFLFLQNIEMNKEPEDYLYFEQMRKQGFIVNSNIDELSRVLRIINIKQYSSNSSKLVYVITPTMLCNYKCTYCFENDRELFSDMEKSVQEKVIEYIQKDICNYNSVKCVNIEWFGGEPLLAIDVIKYISKRVKKICIEHNIEFISSMITNGLLLTKKIALELKNSCNLINVQITIDGTEKNYCERKGATKEQYQRVLKNIEEIADHIDVIIRLNSDKLNFEDLKEFTKMLLINKNLSNRIRVYIARIDQSDFMEDKKEEYFSEEEFNIATIDFNNFLISQCNYSYERFEKKIPRFCGLSCGFMQDTAVAIDSKGNLYKCERTVGITELSIGNVFDGRFYNQMDNDFMNSNFNEECKKCNLFPICLGGCKYDVLNNKIANSCVNKHKLFCHYLVLAYNNKKGGNIDGNNN